MPPGRVYGRELFSERDLYDIFIHCEPNKTLVKEVIEMNGYDVGIEITFLQQIYDHLRMSRADMINRFVNENKPKWTDVEIMIRLVKNFAELPSVVWLDATIARLKGMIDQYDEAMKTKR